MLQNDEERLYNESLLNTASNSTSSVNLKIENPELYNSIGFSLIDRDGNKLKACIGISGYSSFSFSRIIDPKPDPVPPEIEWVN